MTIRWNVKDRATGGTFVALAPSRGSKGDKAREDLKALINHVSAVKIVDHRKKKRGR